MSFIAEIPTRVAGIPCLIGVEGYTRTKPDRGTWSSDWDYLGFTETCWRVLDRRGRVAEWLERKMTRTEEDKITTEIDRYFESRADDRDGDDDRW